MPIIRIGRKAPVAGEKSSRLSIIVAVLGLLGTIGTVALTWADLMDRLPFGPMKVTAGPAECSRPHMAIVLTNIGKHPVLISPAKLTIRRNAEIVQNSIVLTPVPDSLPPNTPTRVTLYPTSVGIPIELPLRGTDQCALDITLTLSGRRKSAERHATCACP